MRTLNPGAGCSGGCIKNRFSVYYFLQWKSSLQTEAGDSVTLTAELGMDVHNRITFASS